MARQAFLICRTLALPFSFFNQYVLPSATACSSTLDMACVGVDDVSSGRDLQCLSVLFRRTRLPYDMAISSFLEDLHID